MVKLTIGVWSALVVWSVFFGVACWSFGEASMSLYAVEKAQCEADITPVLEDMVERNFLNIG